MSQTWPRCRAARSASRHASSNSRNLCETPWRSPWFTGTRSAAKKIPFSSCSTSPYDPSLCSRRHVLIAVTIGALRFARDVLALLVTRFMTGMCSSDSSRQGNRIFLSVTQTLIRQLGEPGARAFNAIVNLLDGQRTAQLEYCLRLNLTHGTSATLGVLPWRWPFDLWENRAVSARLAAQRQHADQTTCPRHTRASRRGRHATKSAEDAGFERGWRLGYEAAFKSGHGAGRSRRNQRTRTTSYHPLRRVTRPDAVEAHSTERIVAPDTACAVRPVTITKSTRPVPSVESIARASSRGRVQFISRKCCERDPYNHESRRQNDQRVTLQHEATVNRSH